MTLTTECFHLSQKQTCGPVVGFLVELRSGGHTWSRPVCAHHAGQNVRRTPTYLGDEVIFVTDPSELRWGTTCGAWRTVGTGGVAADGRDLPSAERWCERSTGPCPLPNTSSGTHGDGRRCAADVETGVADADYFTLPSLG